MTATAGTAAPTATAPQDILAEIQKIAPVVRAGSAQGDQDGKLTDEVVDALHQSGVFGMWVPKELGGAEVDPVTSLKIIQTLAENDPAAAWVSMAAALATGTGGAYLGEEAVQRIFSTERFPVIAGQGTRPGTAKTVEGGYKLSGDWGFASGIKHGQWIHTLGVIEETGEPRIFVLPVEEAELKPESWNVLGLRATGSIDYSIRDTYVPESYTHAGTTTTPLRGGHLFTIGVMHFAITGHMAWALGVARRMLDELKALVHSKAGRPGAIAENQHFHTTYGLLEAKYLAAKGFIYQTWEEGAETIASGGKLSVDQKTRLRLALYHATWTAEEISNEVHKLSGTKAIWPSDIQRYFRDMHTGTQHVTSGFTVPANCGQILAGLAPNHDWLYMDIVPEDQTP